MKALTIWQPWAWAVTTGHKPIENRGWTTGHLGEVAIHAGKTLEAAAAPYISERLRTDRPLPPKWWLRRGVLPTMAFVAVADLTGVCSVAVDGSTCRCGTWAQRGQHHWRLANVRQLPEPIPCRGAQGLWTVPFEHLAALELAAARRTT